MKFVKKGSVKGARGIKTAFKGTISNVIFVFTKQHYGVFQSDSGYVLIDTYVKAGFEIP